MKTAAKLGLLTTLYLSQGLPFGFFTQALPVILRQQDVSLPKIGFASLLALPWALKFLWAPLLDRRAPGSLGRRRGAIIPLQIASALVVLLVGFVDPAKALWLVLASVLVVNFLAATQDVATDGLAVELLAPDERGLGNGVQVAGYRVGMIVGGGVILIVLGDLGWRGAFVAMAATLLAATIPIVLHREAPSLPQPLPPLRLRSPLEWLERPGMARWLVVLGVYKTGDAFASGMLRPFLVDRGLGLPEIGLLLGTVGFASGLAGALAGGWLVNRLGRRPALVLFGILQAGAVGAYALLAAGAAQAFTNVAVICAAEHFTGGMATAALFTAMMDACRPDRAATDYTVQASVVVIATGVAAGTSGLLAEWLGYTGHFALSAGLSLAGTVYVLLFRAGPGGPLADTAE